MVSASRRSTPRVLCRILAQDRSCSAAFQVLLVEKKKSPPICSFSRASRGLETCCCFFFPSPKVGVGLVERERESCHDRDLYDLLGGVGMEKHLCGCVEVGLSAQWTK